MHKKLSLRGQNISDFFFPSEPLTKGFFKICVILELPDDKTCAANRRYIHGVPTTSIHHLLPRPTAGVTNWAHLFSPSFPSFPGSRAQDHRCMLIDKSATISQWPRPFPHFSMSMPRIYSSFKSSLKKWQTCREHFRLKVCLSSTAANGFPLNGSSRLNWFIRTQNVFLIPKIFLHELKMHSFSKPYG